MEYTKQVLSNTLSVLKYNEGLLRESIQRTKEEMELHESSLKDNLNNQKEIAENLKMFD